MSKGITPVVATTLLMLIAVAAVGSASVFLEGTIDDLQTGLEDEMEHDEMVEASDIRVDRAYRGTNGYLMIDVENSGSVTLDIERDGTKLWNLYVEGRPQSWEYFDSSRGGDESIDPGEIVGFNSTVSYPSSGDSVEFSFNAPYRSSDSYICYSEGGNFC
ncbi:MAG: hypothetical protein ACLFTA_00210 [Candidatus Nanohaloarchaea archaeon]